MRLSVVSLFCLAPSWVSAAVSCDMPVPQPLPVRSHLVAPFAGELPGSPPVAAPSAGLLGAVRDERQSVDVVLLRLRDQACAAQQASSSDPYAGYQKKTEHDNTPWRYETKPGEKFSAAEFDAWMKARGVRVAKGKSADAAADTATD